VGTLLAAASCADPLPAPKGGWRDATAFAPEGASAGAGRAGASRFELSWAPACQTAPLAVDCRKRRLPSPRGLQTLLAVASPTSQDLGQRTPSHREHPSHGLIGSSKLSGPRNGGIQIDTALHRARDFWAAEVGSAPEGLCEPRSEDLSRPAQSPWPFPWNDLARELRISELLTAICSRP